MMSAKHLKSLPGAWPLFSKYRNNFCGIFEEFVSVGKWGVSVTGYGVSVYFYPAK